MHGDRQERNKWIDDVYSVIEPVDIAGLADRKRRQWYDVRAGDLLGASHKLGVSETEIESMLRRCGFFEVQKGTDQVI